MVTIDLSGQSALVTGGSGGIGGQICVRLTEAGAHVDVHYRNGEQHAAGVVDQISKEWWLSARRRRGSERVSRHRPGHRLPRRGHQGRQSQTDRSSTSSRRELGRSYDELIEAIDSLRQELVGSEA